MSLSIKRKGTEKPIEIFVALFIILAVALVMLKLFQGQIADKQKELADVQQEQKGKELQDKVRLSCAQKCTEASNNGCSIQSLASLCAYGSPTVLGANTFIDLNNNKVSDVDTTLLAGIGVCEDHVYCFHVMDSCCARRIDAASCQDILKNYWTSKSFTPPAIGTVSTATTSPPPSGLLNATLYPGTCNAAAAVTLWSDLLVP